MPINALFEINDPDFPIIAAALHNGHDLRDEVARLSALDDQARLREEDPFTGQWTNITDNRIIVQTSRFEVDLNRVKHEAVYINPEDAWGLNLWKEKPDVEMINRSLAAHGDFYSRCYIFTFFSDDRDIHAAYYPTQCLFYPISIWPDLRRSVYHQESDLDQCCHGDWRNGAERPCPKWCRKILKFAL